MSTTATRRARRVGLGVLAGWALGLASLAAAAIHAAAAPVHFDQQVLHGTFFLVVALAQAAWALAVVLRPGRRTLLVGAVLQGGVALVWFVSRTTGLPLVPDAAAPEPIGTADAVSTALEVAMLAAILVLVARPAMRVRPVTLPAATGTLGALTTAVVLAAVPAIAAAPNHDHGQHPHGDEAAAHADGAHDHGDGAHDDDGEAAHEAGGQGGGGHHTSECDPTREQEAAADRLVEEVEAGLAQFPTPEDAEAAGYGQLNAAEGRRNGTWHYINPALRVDPDVLDPEHPESIIYAEQPDGSVAPIAAMFMMPEQDVPGPQPAGCLMQWHTHGPPFAPPGDETPEMTHVWTVELSGGAFANHDAVPEYACRYLGRTGVGLDHTGAVIAVAPPDCEPEPRDEPPGTRPPAE